MMFNFPETHGARPGDPFWSLLEEAAACPNGVPAATVCQDVVRLSGLFTRARGALAADYLSDPGLRAAYLAYYLPVNLAKVRLLLDELPSIGSASGRGKGVMRILDVGAGPATAGLAVLEWGRGNGWPVEVLALDRSRPALQAGRGLWDVLAAAEDGPGARLTTLVDDVESSGWLRAGPVPQGRPYDLIVAANVLNELFVSARDPIARRAKLLGALLALLADDGTLMIVEPALRSVTRELHRVRDLLLARGLCTVYSPCVHELPCPALEHEDDWCHEERPWDPPRLVGAIDREVGFIKDAVKFSYLLLRTDGRGIVPRVPGLSRVVSELREMKGEKRLWICNLHGRQEIGRLDRAHSPTNAPLDQCHRGAIVQIDSIAWKTSGKAGRTFGRIEAKSAVEVVWQVPGHGV